MISWLWLILTVFGAAVAALNVWDARQDLIAVKHLAARSRRAQLMPMASSNLLYQELILLSLSLDAAAGGVAVVFNDESSARVLAVVFLVAAVATLTILSIAQRHWRDVEMASLERDQPPTAGE